MILPIEVEGCQRCGQCCREMMFTVDHTDDSAGKDHLEWARLHGLDIVFSRDPRGKQWWGIKLSIPCSQLNEEADGTYRCLIYEKRPQMCRKYDGREFNSSCKISG